MYYVIATQSRKYYIVNEKMEITQYRYWYPEYQEPKFSGEWKIKGLVEVLPFGRIGRTQDLCELVNKNLKYKNGKSKYMLVDVDYGTTRIWGDRIESVYIKENYK